MTAEHAALVDQLRQAGSEGRHVLVSGGRSKPWMHGLGDDREQLSVAGYRGIIDYQPTELVVTVRAGTPLAELDAALESEGQMLTMETPDFNGGSTIGGAVALGWVGSRGVFAGGVRDAVIGMRMINGLGQDLSFGGQVMKNVAGFDVSRLLVGSVGRLGAITELSLRVIPRPEQELSLQWELPDLAASRELVREWTQRGFPVTGASYSAGRFRARFAGADVLLKEVRATCGGEPADGAFWQDLRRLELPLFHHGWGDEKLFDGNGEICWTAHTRRRGNGAVVGLAAGPDWSGDDSPLARLRGRVQDAFDPAGLFQPAGAH